MADSVSMAFEPESVSIAVHDILPLRQVSAVVRRSRKYRQIASAITKVGIAQPPVVARHDTLDGKYLLLEGHLRIEVLKDLGIDQVICLVSLDDEAFTYNRLVNRLATIQEHKMILKLIERGIPEKRIAETLDVDVKHIRAKRDLLHGICPEAAELLKDKHCPIVAIKTLKKMKPLRQVEAAELMIAMEQLHDRVRQSPARVDATGAPSRRRRDPAPEGGFSRADRAHGAGDVEPSGGDQAHRSLLRRRSPSPCPCGRLRAVVARQCINHSLPGASSPGDLRGVRKDLRSHGDGSGDPPTSRCSCDFAGHSAHARLHLLFVLHVSVRWARRR